MLQRRRRRRYSACADRALETFPFRDDGAVYTTIANVAAVAITVADAADGASSHVAVVVCIIVVAIVIDSGDDGDKFSGRALLAAATANHVAAHDDGV
jgi:hypothetical protein